MTTIYENERLHVKQRNKLGFQVVVHLLSTKKKESGMSTLSGPREKHFVINILAFVLLSDFINI